MLSLGDLMRAIEAFEKAISIARQLNDRWQEGRLIGNLGNAYGSGVYQFLGKAFNSPPKGRHWSLKNPEGLDGLARANRLFVFGKQLRFKRYQGDLPYRPLSDVWEDAQKGTYVPENNYVVQTAAKVIERCVLMTSESGDLVLDPTCGSGTTAVVAERWGRRWITCDTSRIALNVARQRLLRSTFDAFKTRNGSPRSGFVYSFFNLITHKRQLALGANTAWARSSRRHMRDAGSLFRGGTCG